MEHLVNEVKEMMSAIKKTQVSLKKLNIGEPVMATVLTPIVF